MEAYFRMESMEHYAMILMYTGNIIGGANLLSRGQVEYLLELRAKLGAATGGAPSRCADEPVNLHDVVSNPSSEGVAFAPASRGDIERIVDEVVRRLGAFYKR
jgi:hypothetical protein